MIPKLPFKAMRSSRQTRLLPRNVSVKTPTFSRNPNYANFQTSASQFLKEDGNRSAEELEAQKREHLKKQERGEGKWDKELASKGEENVKADREEVQDHDKHMEDLQKRTEDKAQKGDV